MHPSPKRSVLAALVALALAMGGTALAQDAGESVYSTNCVACHQATGQGIPGAFPPLANGHIPDLLAAEGGRTYLIDVLLYGLTGEISVQGNIYNGAMPAWAQLSNEQIADVLTYISTTWENQPPEGFEPFTAEEIEAARGQGLTTGQVLEMRQALSLGGE